jgi:hypothetical protein
MFDGFAKAFADSQTLASSVSKLIEILLMFNGQNWAQTEVWIANFKAYLHVDWKLFDDQQMTTTKSIHSSPDINYINKDSLSKVIIALSQLKGKAAECHK